MTQIRTFLCVKRIILYAGKITIVFLLFPKILLSNAKKREPDNLSELPFLQLPQQAECHCYFLPISSVLSYSLFSMSSASFGKSVQSEIPDSQTDIELWLALCCCWDLQFPL